METRKTSWGRYANGDDTFNVFLSALLFIFPPIFVVYVWTSCNKYDCTLDQPFLDMYNNSDWTLMLPTFHLNSFFLLIFWILFQGLMYAFIPGKIVRGQITPAGNILPYCVNGLTCYIITHVLFILLSFCGIISPTIIYDHWEGFFVAANMYGYFLTFFSMIKAHYFPSHPEDCKFSGSFIYDLVMGIELNPRIGKLWDFKLFHNTRIGIIAWTLINLSFMAAQYQIYGYISNSMILVNILQFTYVIDLFINEEWYCTKTIDITHDSLGYYLCFGDSVFLPFMYTLQAQYLVNHPIDLTNSMAYFILFLGFFGYLIFRLSNHQRNYFRTKKGDCKIWGRDPEYIIAKYTTSDGNQHESLLLHSGFWGLSRHFNYFGDLCLSLAYCLSCGFSHILPYFYIFFMLILLTHRVWRDDTKCREKYGMYWDEYCKKVPYKILPYVY